ncbi:MAG: hypothetical protein E7Z92_06045 [Cyanobacteria bacterium SIG31]|nr:hypothetical protein [Cyanobacteria bacterium SIG31]
MKISAINSINFYRPNLNIANSSPNTTPKVYNSELARFNEISFQGANLKYLSAKKYVAQKVQPRLKKYPERIFNLWNFDLNKLEGIQNGIKVFKNMSMKEIAFFLTTVAEFATFRGCYNNCAHCYADAKPPLKETENQTTGMSWEDFTNLIKGIKTLNRRLGFFASGKNVEHNHRYLTPFHDSDSMEVFMKDKNGNIYDVMDITKKLYKAMGVEVIFDTASWHPKSKARQEKAEKYVEFMTNPKNKKMFEQINVSLNSFHAMHRKEVELRKENKTELADRIRDLYTTRMANTLFTFTPLIKSKQLNLLIAVAPDKENFEGYRVEELAELYDEMTDKLWELYQQDLQGEQKYIKSIEDAEIYMDRLDKQLEHGYRFITFAEKSNRTLHPDEDTLNNEDTKLEDSVNIIKNLNQRLLKKGHFVGILDANGKFYLTNYRLTVPTEIKLNFENNKKTAGINPNLKPELVITKEEIENLK